MISFKEFTNEEMLLEEKEVLKLFDEAVYQGNLGLMETFKFFSLATSEQKAELKEITERKDWNAFKELILKVTGIKLI